jgi:chorismate mutase
MQAKCRNFAIRLVRTSIPAMSVKALRGATQVAANDADSIRTGTVELVVELLSRNGLTSEDLISCIFTVTPDLDAEFPATAAREAGLDQVPLLCASEIPVPGAMERVVRVLVHCELAEGQVGEHVYLSGAQALRPDLNSAQ